MMSNPKPKRAYTAPYWGTQLVETYPRRLMDLIAEQGAYADLTAGGGRYPYHVHTELGVPVVINDRNPYVVSYHRAVFTFPWTSKPWSEWLELATEATDPLKVQPVDGLITQDQQLLLPTETKQYLDGLTTREGPLPTFILRAAVAASLLTHCSYRGYGWAKTTTEKALVSTIPPNTVRSWVIQRINILYQYGVHTKPHLCRVHNTDLFTWDPTTWPPFPENTVVYTDPAWPWNEANSSAGSKNPYEFLTHLGYITHQLQPSPTTRFWSRKLPAEEIVGDVLKWMQNAKSLGAKFFVVSTQSTNYPPVETVYNLIQKQYELLWRDKTPVRSTFSKSTLTDEFACFKLE